MHKGFVPILVLLLIAGFMGAGIIFQRNFPSATSTQETPIASPEDSPTGTAKPIVTVKPTPTVPPLKSVSVSGFSFEDRNDDGPFNNVDVKLGYMQFYLYDTYEPTKQLSTVFSDVNGNFSITLNVRDKLRVTPTTYNNFRPRGAYKEFGSSATGVDFGFISLGVPNSQNVGIIEGDVYHDANRNLVKDGGEERIRFYKLYLHDGAGSYYNTIEGAQATDASGHFKYENLPTGKSYILQLSNPTGQYEIFKPETTLNLLGNQTEIKNIEIPVYQNY